MTNLKAWRILNSDNPAPANFIDACFYFMISAALERRAWQGIMERKPLFFNTYDVLVGPPGVGKSYAMDTVKEFLHMLINPDAPKTPKVPQSALNAVDITNILAGDIIKHDDEPEYILNFSADASSYEALVRRMVQKTNSCVDEAGLPYAHNSMAAIIDEFTSLFTRDSLTTKDFLLSMYSCGKYKKDTIKHGLQVIHNPCFSLLSGTTPSRIVESKDINILDDGFAARTFFIYGSANRFDPPIRQKPYTGEQLACRDQIFGHLMKLTKYYGGIDFTDAAVEWLEDRKNTPRGNKSWLLDGYYVRKILHLRKLAGLVTFSEDAKPKIIPIEAVHFAAHILHQWEKQMHKAFSDVGRNELAPVANRIVDLCREAPLLEEELLLQFYNEVTGQQLELILQDLVKQGRLYREPTTQYSVPIKTV